MTHNKSLEEQLQSLFSGLEELLETDEPLSEPALDPAPGPIDPLVDAPAETIPAPVPPDPQRNGTPAAPPPEKPPASDLLAPPLPAVSPAPLGWSAVPALNPPRPVNRPGVNWRFMGWSVFTTVVFLLLIAFGQALLFASPGEQQAGGQPRFVLPPTPTPLVLPTQTATPMPRPVAPGQGFSFAQATAMPTPVPGGQVLILTPEARSAGWVASADETIISPYDPQNHFGDSYLYAGVLAGKIYHGAIQFNLSRIPRGAQVYAASLRLTGLRADQLGQPGQWRLQMLAPEVDYHWRDQNFEQIHAAAVWTTLEPALVPEMLGEDRVNLFEFTPEQLRLLERRVLEGGDKSGRLVSFRLDGPLSGENNLFAWDSGAGPASKGKNAGPQLFMSLGAPPAATPPPYYVVITSTPTPETIETAVLISLQMTAQAERIGTATPLPPHWVTPVVVTVTPTAANKATAAKMAAQATAIALTTGEPPNLATATATPTYVVITSTPTPLTLETAAAQAALVTAAANTVGTATPFPKNWVTPVVVVSTPTPENTATVSYWQAVALTTGTATPTPGNVQTATPTPVLLVPMISPTTTPTPTPTFQPVPAALVGQIVFLSDREGASEAERQRADKLKVTPTVIPQPYVYNPVTGQVQRLTDLWPYQSAARRDAWSADKRYQTYNQKLLWTNIEGRPTQNFAIHTYDYHYNVETQITFFGQGDAWDPAWSPLAERVALVSNDSGDDEIWVINRDGSNALRLTETNEAYNAQHIGKDNFLPEVNGHPSWSPDGTQIVFWSNRSGNRQIWLMDADGSNQRLLLPPTAYADWDPVWIKYTDPPPSLERLPDWRFVKPDNEK